MAHKPGAIPLRPLGLGDIYDGAFKIIRFSPGATVGSAVLVTAVAMAIPILITSFLATLFDLSLTTFESTQSSSAEVTDLIAANGTLLGGSVLQAIGLIFVTGMVAHVTAAAAIGRRLSLGQAWAATRGSRGKLVGLSVLLGLGTVLYLGVAVAAVAVLAVTLPPTSAIVVGVLAGLAALVGLVFLWGRVYYLAVPPLMLEPVGVLAALGRSWRLTSRQFWRTIGIALLTLMITQVIGGILSVPFTIVGTVATFSSGDSELGLILYLVTTGLAAVVSSAFVAPFTSAVTTLQYLDLRMRKEGYDVELLTRAGITGS
ncbi:MAG: hypothetical protein NTV23_16480 [Propionibacteriales bacterium]|nr:hypothetical protein [Propionibacteriales bacterium]